MEKWQKIFEDLICTPGVENSTHPLLNLYECQTMQVSIIVSSFVDFVCYLTSVICIFIYVQNPSAGTLWRSLQESRCKVS